MFKEHGCELSHDVLFPLKKITVVEPVMNGSVLVSVGLGCACLRYHVNCVRYAFKMKRSMSLENSCRSTFTLNEILQLEFEHDY